MKNTKNFILIVVVVVFAIGFIFFFQSSLTGSVLRDELPNEMFQQLPAMPADFHEKNDIDNLIYLDESYFKQPEFYPTFEEFIPKMRTPDTSYKGVIGYGAYPSDVRITAHRNDEISVATLIHASWLVENYQGMQLEADSEYFDIEIEPSTLLLEPTFPSFGKDWTHKVIVRIKADAPEGNYIIGINPVPPEHSFSDIYENYSEPGGFGLGRPLFQIHVNVV